MVRNTKITEKIRGLKKSIERANNRNEKKLEKLEKLKKEYCEIKKTQTKLKTISLRLNEKDFEKIHIIAKCKNQSISDFIREQLSINMIYKEEFEDDFYVQRYKKFGVLNNDIDFQILNEIKENMVFVRPLDEQIKILKNLASLTRNKEKIKKYNEIIEKILIVNRLVNILNKIEFIFLKNKDHRYDNILKVLDSF